MSDAAFSAKGELLVASIRGPSSPLSCTKARAI
jgi:hypothetical protein